MNHVEQTERGRSAEIDESLIAGLRVLLIRPIPSMSVVEAGDCFFKADTMLTLVGGSLTPVELEAEMLRRHGGILARRR
jgi:hypothetical protein